MQTFLGQAYGYQGEVFQVNEAEACSFPRQNTVEKELDKFRRSGVGANVSRVAYVIVTNGGAGAIRVIVLGMNFAYHHGVTYFLPFVERYVLIVDEKEGVSAIHTLGAQGVTRADALAETTKFIGV